MRRTSLIVVLTAASFAASAAPLRAQCGPGYRHCCPGSYGGCGVVLFYDLGREWTTTRHLAQSEHLLGQQIAALQTAALQSDIRGAVAADAQRRCEQIFARQQADRDWWLEVQQQQIAQRQQAAQWAAMTAGFKAEGKVATDVIQWPPLLQASPFAQSRTQIEAPYRRKPQAAAPTAADYKNTLAATEQMRSTLKSMTAKLTAQDYFDSQRFLDQLAAEARGRLKTAGAKK